MNTIFNTKTNNNKKDLLFITHPILFTFFYIILLTITLLYIPKISYAKNPDKSAPKFQDKYNTIYVGKSYKYIILHKPQNSSVKFSINNKKLANLNSNTGLLSPKKEGTVKLKAEIKTQHKKIILTKKITIKNKTNIKNNSELFSPPSHINNINFTVKLKCTRIMQQSQVENSSISLSKNDSLANGNFKSLSDDGRYITYELNSSSVRLLSPGDRSMDGTYQLSCTLSKETYNINYYEHMLGQAVTGFVFDSSKRALENADITLTDNNITVSAKTDKNGYYIIRFPKATNVTMSVSYKNYFSKYYDNISLKIAKAICKNVMLHTDANDVSKDLAVSFNIAGNDNSATKIELATQHTSINAPDDQTTLQTFFTDNLGNLLLTDSEQSYLSSQTDVDTITISDKQKFLSHTDNADITGNIQKDIFNFSYNQNYYVRVYSTNKDTYTLKSEFCFSFNDFTSKHLVFNITLPNTEKTNYSKSLLPIDVGSNVDYDKINYCNVRLYRIGIKSPLCTFNFSENTPANFRNQIDKMNLYLNDGNIYYAIFQLYDYENKELFSPVLHRFSVNNSKIYFESDTITFDDSTNADTQFSALPSYCNTITNVSLLSEDTTCLNTVFCSYNSYGDIDKTVLTSLSSQLLQQELLKSSTPCIVYTNNSEFDT